MTQNEKNPFEIFGITPDITIRLDSQDLFTVVKAMYRTLLKVHHPDRSVHKAPKTAEENAALAVDLNLAFEKLNLERNPQSFQKYRKAYALRRPRGLRKRITELEHELGEVRQREENLAGGYMEHLLRALPWAAGNGHEPQRLTPPLADVKFGLNDVAITQNLRSTSWNIGSNYKEIIFDPLGVMFYRPVGRSKAFQANYIHLLGAVETSRIDLLPILDRVPPKKDFFKSPALDSRYGIDGAPLQVLNTITIDKFKKYCLPLLTSELQERSYLFSIHRPVFEAESRISLEGVIIKISRP